MDSKFKKFIELTRILKQSKEDLSKIMQYYISSIQDETMKAIAAELMKNENLEGLFQHMAEKMQEKFDETFTEKELDSLIELYSNPVLNKWMDFSNDIKPALEESTTEWLQNNVKFNE